MIKMFIILLCTCTEVIIEDTFTGFIQNMVVFIENQRKFDFFHHAPCAERVDVMAKLTQ